MHKKKLLTIDDLVAFCEKRHLEHFSAKDSDEGLFVQVPAMFEKIETDDTMLYAYIRVFHTGLNRNKSIVTDNAADHCMRTLAYKPLLASFTDVNGEPDFTYHDYEKVKDENGKDKYIFYEKQVGCFTADKPEKKYDKELGHDYIYAKVAIPRDYTQAAEIIERKNGTRVSVELDILELSFNLSEGAIEFNDAIVAGCTLLGVDPETGEEVDEGMIGASISLESFSKENNSVTMTVELLEELKKFNANFATINNNSKEGGKGIVFNKELFAQLLKQYNKTAEDVTFDYESLSDDELTAAFKENFEEEGNDPDPSDDPEPDNGGDDKKNFSLALPDGKVMTFGMTVDDLWIGLFTLVNDTYGEIDNEFYSVDIDLDEKTVVMVGWSGANNFRQSWKRRGEDISLEGERVPVKRIWVSELEEKALNDAKANFEALETKFNETADKLAKYESEPEKLELINSEKFALIKDTDEYKDLAKRESYFSMSNDEIETKLKDIVLQYALNEPQMFTAKTKPKEKEDQPKDNAGFRPFMAFAQQAGEYDGLIAKYCK